MSKFFQKIECLIFGHRIEWKPNSMKDGEYCYYGCGKYFNPNMLSKRIESFLSDNNK